jgi:type VI secretion system protein ImpE
LLVQFPAQSLGIVQFRSLLRGEQARREVAEQGRVPELLTEPTAALRTCLQTLVALRAGDPAEAARHAAAAEAARPPLSGTADGADFDDLRDLDDVYGPVLEFLTGQGDCAWVPLEHIAAIKLQPPTRIRDLVWRHAELHLADGRTTAVFVPMLYPATYRETNDALRLGRATEWKEPTTGLVQGVGQRMWLVGDDVRPLVDIKVLTINPPPPTAA